MPFINWLLSTLHLFLFIFLKSLDVYGGKGNNYNWFCFRLQMCTVTVFPDSSFRLRISEISISEFGVLFRFSTVFLFSTYDFTFSDFGLSCNLYFLLSASKFPVYFFLLHDIWLLRLEIRFPSSNFNIFNTRSFFPFLTLKFHFQLSIRSSSFLNRADRIWEGILFIASHMWHQNMIPSKREVQQCTE